MNLLILKFVHSRNVFPNDVELDVDDGSLLDGVEVGVVEGVGDDADLEGVGCGAANGETDAVDCHAPLIDGEIAVLGQQSGQRALARYARPNVRSSASSAPRSPRRPP